MSKPLVSHIYTADLSTHLFNNRLYIYPSYDRETEIKFNDNGDQYDMADYHILSLSEVNGPVNRPRHCPLNGRHPLGLETALGSGRGVKERKILPSFFPRQG